MKRTYFVLGLMFLLVAAQVGLAQAPPAPTNLVAQLSLGSHPVVGLTWQESGMGMFFFKVYRSVDDTSHFQLLDMAKTREYKDYLVFSGHTYYYAVTAVAAMTTTPNILESGRSNIVSVVISPVSRHFGTISGVVTDSLTGRPLPLVRVLFFHTSSPLLWIPEAWTDTLGRYKAVLDTGTYLINAQWLLAMSARALPVYLPEWYKDARDARHATPVIVADSAQVTVNMDLERFVPPVQVWASGTVTDTLGMPLKGATVTFMRTPQELVQVSAINGDIPGLGVESMDIAGMGHYRGVLWAGVTDSNGHYRAPILAGQAYVAAAVKPGYLPQYFNHKTSPLTADIIVTSHDTAGIDFALSPNPLLANSVSGVVRDSLGTRVPSRIILIPVHHLPGGIFIRFTATDSLGAYTINNVKSGDYFVMALPFSDYAPAFYKAGQYGILRWRQADTVKIAGSVTGIDIGVVAIHSGGLASITGKVRASGLAIAGANVFALNAQGAVVGYGLTDGSGDYLIDAVPPGPLTILADVEGYQSAQGNVNVSPLDYSISNDITLAEIATSVSTPQQVPNSFGLAQNYPNPFNPSTKISFSLPVVSNVTLKVFNLLGQEIASLKNGAMNAGNHQIVWNGTDNAGKVVASGVYFYQLNATPSNGGESFSSMKKMLLLK